MSIRTWCWTCRSITSRVPDRDGNPEIPISLSTRTELLIAFNGFRSSLSRNGEEEIFLAVGFL